jgi:hypothetical protein
VSHIRKNVRNAIKQDMLQFAIPAVIVFVVELILLARDGVSGFLGEGLGSDLAPQQHG